MTSQQGETMNTGHIIAGVLGTGAALCAVAALGVGTSWFGLVTTRPMMQYAEDSRRLTFEHSRAHIDGTNAAISDYCLNMRSERDPQVKSALDRYILAETSTFQGQLTSDAAACVAEARGGV